MFSKTIISSFACSLGIISYVLGTLILFTIIMSAGVVPLLITSKFSSINTAAREKEFLYLSDKIINERLKEHEGSSWEVAGLVLGLGLPDSPFNGSISERIHNQSVTNFEFVVDRYVNLASSAPDCIFVAPGGVITQVNRFEELFQFQDLMLPEYMLQIQSVLNSSSSLSQTKFLLRNESTAPNSSLSWNVLQVHLVYQEDVSNTTAFWGLTGSWSSVEDSINENELLSQSKKYNMDFLLSVTTGKNKLIFPIASSQGFSFSTPQSVLLDFVISSKKKKFQMEGDALFDIFVRRTPKERKILYMRVPWIVTMILIGLLVIFCILLALHLSVSSVRASQSFRAPCHPPFAMLIIGPHKGEKMLNLTAEALSSVMERSKAHFRANQIPQLQSYSTTYILQSVKEAVKMGSAVLQAVRDETINSVYSFYREESPILVCAVHWCQDAEVDRSIAEGSLVYRGEDIMYGKNLFDIGVGNAIVLSLAARDKLSETSSLCNHLHEFSLPNHFKDIFYFFVDSSSTEMVQAFIYAQESFTYSSLVQCVPVLRKRSEESIPLPVDEGMSLYPVSAFLPVRFERTLCDTANASDKGKEDTLPLSFDPSSVPEWLDRTLRKNYETYFFTLGPVHWLKVRVIIYYFYFSCAILLHPLAPRERRNITECLAKSFGVPTSRLYEHFAVRGALEFAQSTRNNHGSLN